VPGISVISRPIGDLKPDAGNPRRHSQKQIKQIAKSIATFGFNVPVLLDANLKVIAGHGRLLACRKLGWTEVPTISLTHLTEAQARAFAIADNRLTEIATWDDHLLAQQLRDLSLADLDFNLEVTGFEMGEIDLRIAALEAETADVEDPGDVAPEPNPGPPVCKEGDLWLLGEHRVLCGSALDAEAYRVLMRDDRAALVFTDPPYNVPIDGHASGLGVIHHHPFPMVSGERDTAAFTTFLSNACRNLARFSLGGSFHFVCLDWRRLEEGLAAGREAFGELKDLCVWVKNKPGGGEPYRNQHELIFVFQQGEAADRNNISRGQFGRDRSNVWRYPGGKSVADATGDVPHPKLKPVAMVADAILDGSTRRDIVLDGFLGSGATLIAAERTGRRCYGLELDPVRVDTIILRWQRLTGGSARHAESGRCFDNLASEAEATHAA